MWKKENEENELPQTHSAPEPARKVSPIQQLKERAVIGHSICFKGDITGTEDLEVHGTIEGTVVLRDNTITIGERGQVKADIQAKVVSVEGSVNGNLSAEEKVVVRKSGTIHGNIVSPRVTLEDGCKFTGSIDMESSKKGLASIAKNSNSKDSITRDSLVKDSFDKSKDDGAKKAVM